MEAIKFQRKRNKLIWQYRIAVQPAWKEYNDKLAKFRDRELRCKVRGAFCAAIKPHLERLFNQIEDLKKSRDVPEIGEIRKGSEIGSKHIYRRYIWYACEYCGKRRWVLVVRGRPINLLCRICSGKKAYRIRSEKVSGRKKKK